MKTRIPVIALSVIAFASIAGIAQDAAAPAIKPAPLAIDLQKVKLEIVNAEFITELEGTSQSYSESQPDKYHALLMTVKATKPANTELHIKAADLCVHYYYDDSSDVVPCKGLSSVSTTLKTDRTMEFFSQGFGSTRTQKFSTEAETVYFDVFFTMLEPNISRVYLFVGQEVDNAATQGWTPE